MKRKTKCKNGNTVERFYDRSTRSCVAVVKDPDGNQVGDASYNGDKVSADSVTKFLIRDNGGLEDRKVLFLDVDGVLNGFEWFSGAEYEARKVESARENHTDSQSMYRTHLDPRCVRLLREILEATGAKIVLSSTWRRLPMLVNAFLRTENDIPNLTEIYLGNTPIGKDRGFEIKEWIETNRFTGKFVIVDDWGPDAFNIGVSVEPLAGKLVQTCPGLGLTKKTAAEIIHRLGRL